MTADHAHPLVGGQENDAEGGASHQHSHSHADHGHGTGGHAHAPASFGKAFAIGIALNIAYVGAEAFYGLVSHSLALLADAGHNLGDVLGLAAAWGAAALGQLRPTKRFTYGYKGTSILAALSNAIVLLIITGGLTWEAVRRLLHPEHAAGVTIMIVAAGGIVVNAVTAFLFMSGRKDDLNIKAAFLHMASDALLAAGVVAAGALIAWTGWLWVDPVVTIVVGGVIVVGTWSVLRDATALALDAVPRGIDHQKVETYLAELPGVTEVHDLHIWAMSTTETALTAHLVRPEVQANDDLLHLVANELGHRFGIRHPTVQIETGNSAHDCGLAPSDVV